MDNKTLSRDGTPIAYHRTGRGPVVVLVSGAMSTGATVAPLATALSDRFSAVVYDRRGRGESGDTAPYAVEREVEDLAAVLDAVGGDAALYGVSSGGALALRAAAGGLPARRVAVYEPPFEVREGHEREHAAYSRGLAEALAEGRRGDAVELFLGVTGLAPQMIVNARQSPMWPGLEAVAPTLAYDDAVMGDGTVPRDLLASLRVPLLALAGGASPEWMREAARRAAAAAPEGAHRVLEGQTHAVEPEVLAPVLAEFYGA
ncbi:alpha/beta fold hydrolase [Streptomyces sp. NPDC047017]|uniref:alpha/beta fold hydrolase n=1 Tax=Streptomyces sp. NPDC047017 TaxID=3155024 RepID=UPI0034059AD9